MPLSAPHVPFVQNSRPCPPFMHGVKHCAMRPSQGWSSAAPAGHVPPVGGDGFAPDSTEPSGGDTVIDADDVLTHTDIDELHPEIIAHPLVADSVVQSLATLQGFVQTPHSHERPPQSESDLH